MSGAPPSMNYNRYLQQQLGGLQHGLFGQSAAQNYGNASYLAQQQLAAYHQYQQFRNQLLTLPRAEYAPEKPPKWDGFRIGEITGWRCWRIKDHGFLTSISADEIWAPDEPMTCRDAVSGIEGSGKGDIGIHVFKLQRDALKFAEEWGGVEPIIWGKVEIWGDVVEHELGYRAEFARIVSIDDAMKLHNKAAVLRDLRAKYCEVGL